MGASSSCAGSGEPRSAGGSREEPAEGGEQYALVGEALGAERSDQAEDVVDAEVVGEALVGDVVGDEGVAGGADAGKPALEFGAAGLAEVVALVVAVAAADGPAVGVEEHQGVLLVGFQGDARRGVQPEHGAYDVVEVAQEPLGGDGAGGPAGAGGEPGHDVGEAGVHRRGGPARGGARSSPAMQTASSPGRTGCGGA